MKKVAICGVWHVHAKDYTQVAMEKAQIIGVWDKNEASKLAFCEEMGLKPFDSFEELLASEAEGVIVCTATSDHKEVMVKIADAKKDIFTEKVLAITEEDCDVIAEAVERNNVKFVISLVNKYAAGPLTVKSVIDSGELGKMVYLRFRNCHSGSYDNWLPAHFYNREECGGGAMIDLGAHGMYITDWYCGVPVKSRSVFTTACTNEATKALNVDRVEDNAVTIMEFENGCIAVNETGFVSSICSSYLTVEGERGFVIYQGGMVQKSTLDTQGRLVEVPMCEDLPMPIEQFLTDNILEGCGLKDAKALTHLMVEAYK